MSDLPARTPPAALSTAAAAGYAAESLSAATRRAYRADWADWSAWCAQLGHQPLPAAPEAIAAYLAALASTHGRSALRRRLSAIGQAHAVRPYVRRQELGGSSYDARGEPEGCPCRRAYPRSMEDEPWRRLAQFSSALTLQS